MRFPSSYPPTSRQLAVVILIAFVVVDVAAVTQVAPTTAIEARQTFLEANDVDRVHRERARDYVPLEVHVSVQNLTGGWTPLGHEVVQLQGARPNDGVSGQIHYTLGFRVDGDLLVAHTNRNQGWPTPQNVRVVLTYPASGLGAQVTCVAVQVDQSTNLGKAYVTQGDLLQRRISIAVEAYNVVTMNYSAQFYGVP